MTEGSILQVSAKLVSFGDVEPRQGEPAQTSRDWTMGILRTIRAKQAFFQDSFGRLVGRLSTGSSLQVTATRFFLNGLRWSVR